MQTGGLDPGGQTGGSKGALKQGLYLQSTAGQVRVYCAHQQGLSAPSNTQKHAGACKPGHAVLQKRDVAQRPASQAPGSPAGAGGVQLLARQAAAGGVAGVLRSAAPGSPSAGYRRSGKQ
jgi:hypothetical protein